MPTGLGRLIKAAAQRCRGITQSLSIPEPIEILLRANPGIHHNEGLEQHVRGRKGGDHPLQGARLTDVSIKDIASFGETVGIQNQPQGHQRTIRPLLLGMTEVRLAVVLPRPLKKGVGQIIQTQTFL